MRVNTNVKAINAHRNMSWVDNELQKSLEKLSSGLRINRASDDAGGLAISETLRTQTKGLAQSERNSQDGLSLLSTAEGVLQEVSDMLQRMREIAVQSANGTLTDTQRQNMNVEVNQLGLEIGRFQRDAKFNGLELFSINPPANPGDPSLFFTLQVGANMNETMQVGTPQLDAGTMFIAGGAFAGAVPGDPNDPNTPLPVGTFVDTQANAQTFIGVLDDVINYINKSRATIGSQMNRLEHTIAAVQTTRENLTAAESRIRDVDMASEMTNLTKRQILMQSSTAMLAQANAAPQNILSLFQ